MNQAKLAVAVAIWIALDAQAQFRPPAFMGGIPGRAQTQAIFLQRQQARDFLYREALNELRKNPAAADLPPCGPQPTPQPCLAAPAAVTVAAPPVPVPAAPISAPALSAAVPPLTPAPARTPRRLALLIGNNAYQPPIPELDTPIADVSEVAKVLREHFGFETQILKNGTQSAIIDAFNKMAADTTPVDNVLLFYAGHGYLLNDIKMGFWIPVGASVKTAKGWISNQDISKLLAAIPARQLMLISDSCFSGSLTKEAQVTTQDIIKIDDILRRRSVLVLSSGGDEPVSDEGRDGHSIFAWNLIQTLQDTSGIMAGSENVFWRN